jgi:hypothetical protein
MLAEFTNKLWSFKEVSKIYILNDCIALFQVLIKFYSTLTSQFPINPLSSVSAPSLAFKIWRTKQLPLLTQNVIDFSNTNWDTYLRQSYKGGIVDVYNFHLQGEGYYYDVNSLYPTAMCKPMPIGKPLILDPSLFNEEFFGFVDCTVQTPVDEFIGLLSIKLKGRLTSPKGQFRDLFFSEELHFALANGYTIIKIHNLIKFQKGEAFKELILILNQMKIDAQLNKQPTIRNVAKLLMNSMYGRFVS